MPHQTKPWRCRGGHILGLVRRNGSGKARLLLFRRAVGRAEDGEVMAEVVGEVRGVVCSVCGRRRDWIPRV